MDIKKILVVDDDSIFRGVMEKILKKAGYEVLQANNGYVAKEVLSLEKVDLIFSDVKMSVIHGIELLHYVKKNYSTPFVLMTGFSDLIEATEAFEIGSSGFLTKPFNKSNLIEVIDQISGKSVVDESERCISLKDGSSTNYSYVPVDIFQFINGSQFQCPIYIKLSEAKYVKIALEGQDLSHNKLVKYKEKGIDFLYLHKNDFKSFLNLNVRVTDAVVKSTNAHKDKKLNFLKNTSELLIQFGFQKHVDVNVFVSAQKNVQHMLSIACDQGHILKLLENWSSESPNLFAHSLAVALISNLILHSRQWSSPTTLYKVTLAALIHDIGLVGMPKELLYRSESEMNKKELEIYKTHPLITTPEIELLDLSHEIIQIKEHHHERANGKGFPRGLSKGEIHPCARVISISDEFCKYYQGHPGFEHIKSPREILKHMKVSKDIFGNINLRSLYKVFELNYESL